jgi:hypothetical protein
MPNILDFVKRPNNGYSMPSSSDKFIGLESQPEDQPSILDFVKTQTNEEKWKAYVKGRKNPNAIDLGKLISTHIEDLQQNIQAIPHEPSVFADTSEYDAGERAFGETGNLGKFLGQIGYTAGRYATTPVTFPYEMIKGAGEAEGVAGKEQFARENILGLLKMVADAPKQVQIMAARAVGMPPSKETLQQLGYEEAERSLAEAPESPGFGLLMARGGTAKLEGRKATDISQKAMSKEIKAGVEDRPFFEGKESNILDFVKQNVSRATLDKLPTGKKVELKPKPELKETAPSFNEPEVIKEPLMKQAEQVSPASEVKPNIRSMDVTKTSNVTKGELGKSGEVPETKTLPSMNMSDEHFYNMYSGLAGDLKKMISDAREVQTEFLNTKGMNIEQAGKLSNKERAKLQMEFDDWQKSRSTKIAPEGIIGEQKKPWEISGPFSVGCVRGVD